MQVNGSDRRLMWHGAILFLLAVFSGWLMVLASVRNPRMILSTHLNALFSALLLMIVGALDSQLRLDVRARRALFWSLVLSQYLFFVTGVFAGVTGTASMFAGPAEMKGTAAQEAIALFGNVIGVILSTLGGLLLAWGLRVSHEPR